MDILKNHVTSITIGLWCKRNSKSHCFIKAYDDNDALLYHSTLSRTFDPLNLSVNIEESDKKYFKKSFLDLKERIYNSKLTSRVYSAKIACKD